MKKFLLSLIMMAFAGYISAQSFTFEHNGETLEPGYYEVVGDIDYNTWDMQFIVDITNNSGAPINVTCVRTITEQSEGTSFTMCFGELCGGPYTERLDADIASGASEEFSAHFVPLFNEDFTKPIYGSSMTVELSFFENIDDEPVVFTVKFICDDVSVNDYTDNKIFSNAYPNPAKNMVSFDYNMPNDVQTASVAIYNMMGQEVLKQDLNIGDSRLDVNVSDLADGVYFYSLIVNNQAVKTNKLVVSK